MRTTTTTEELRQRILSVASFDLRTLAHPVDRMTIDAASVVAGVSASTVSNQAGSTADFRNMLHLRLIDRAQMRPGLATWAALHDSLRSTRSVLASLSAIGVARMSELAADPAFPFVLGAFANLDVPGLTERIDHYCITLGAELRPLLEAAIAAHGGTIRTDRTDTQLDRTIATVIMSGALRDLIDTPQHPWTIDTDDGPTDLLVIALARQLGVTSAQEGSDQ